MTRANKIVVKANENGYVATFKRTHKLIADIHSNLTDWVTPDNANKTIQRESFRQWVIDHANEFDIEYKPEDMRTDGNIRVAQYTTDEVLSKDVVAFMVDNIKELVQGCKYKTEWAGMTVDEITPKTHTGRGTQLDRLGIKDGKYSKSHNWAWADITCTATVRYKNSEVYLPFMVELVSGQLRKPKITKTTWAEMTAYEIIAAGLATEEELNPPEKEKSKTVGTESKAQDTAEISVLTPEEIRKIRKKDELVEYAHSIGIAVTDLKMKDLKEKVIRHAENLAKAE